MVVFPPASQHLAVYLLYMTTPEFIRVNFAESAPSASSHLFTGVTFSEIIYYSGILHTIKKYV